MIEKKEQLVNEVSEESEVELDEEKLEEASGGLNPHWFPARKKTHVKYDGSLSNQK